MKIFSTVPLRDTHSGTPGAIRERRACYFLSRRRRSARCMYTRFFARVPALTQYALHAGECSRTGGFAQTHTRTGRRARQKDVCARVGHGTV